MKNKTKKRIGPKRGYVDIGKWKQEWVEVEIIAKKEDENAYLVKHSDGTIEKRFQVFLSKS